MPINPNIYNIDYSKLVTWLTPAPLRKAKLTAWLTALIQPMETVYNLFVSYRTAKLYELTITPQVCYLERLLNDRWDINLRRIVIEDAPDRAPVVYYLEAELKYVNYYLESENLPVVYYTEGEAGQIKDDFVILVPTAISFSRTEMTSMVTKFKLASTKFKIIQI